MFVTLILFLFILGLLVFVHEFGHFWVAKKNGVVVHEFAFGFKPRLFSWKRNGTEYAINLLPFGGYVRLEGEDGESSNKGSFAGTSTVVKVKILIAGIAMNVGLAWVVLTLAYMVGSVPLTFSFGTHPLTQTAYDVQIAEVAADSPASELGWQIGDSVVTIDTTSVTTAQSLIELTKAHGGQTTMVGIRHGDELRHYQVVPRVNPPGGQGALGIRLAELSTTRSPFWAAPIVGILELGSETKQTLVGIGHVFGDLVVHQRVSQDVSGLVGVGVATGEVRRLGFGPILQFIALISINLALINLLPIPPLDGGHIMFAILERWHRNVVQTVRHYLTMGGLALLVLFALVVTYKDIIRFDIIHRLF